VKPPGAGPTGAGSAGDGKPTGAGKSIGMARVLFSLEDGLAAEWMLGGVRGAQE